MNSKELYSFDGHLNRKNEPTTKGGLFVSNYDFRSGSGSSKCLQVAPDQPNCLGLDSMFLLDMELHILKGEIYNCTETSHTKDALFRFFDIAGILRKFGLPDSDLVPVEDLPPPEESHKLLPNTRKSNYVVDLGTL